MWLFNNFCGSEHLTYPHHAAKKLEFFHIAEFDILNHVEPFGLFL